MRDSTNDDPPHDDAIYGEADAESARINAQTAKDPAELGIVLPYPTIRPLIVAFGMLVMFSGLMLTHALIFGGCKNSVCFKPSTQRLHAVNGRFSFRVCCGRCCAAGSPSNWRTSRGRADAWRVAGQSGALDQRRGPRRWCEPCSGDGGLDVG